MLDEKTQHLTLEKKFLIAVGASAGGLEAISEFLAHLPNNLANFSIIIAQHLSPNYKSRLVELLSRQTLFPVTEATNGSFIEEKTIYITPPDCDITVSENERIILTKPAHTAGPKPCVDILFRSIAEVYKEKAIGIVLSGTGNDGSLGIQKIKENGGLTLCQDPKTAKYDGMPLAAKETHKIDFITAPSKMGLTIAKYIKNPNVYQLSSKNIPLKKIIETLSNRTDIDFFHYKQSTIERRIKKRLQSLGIANYEEYLEYIDKNSEEIDFLLENVLIGVTSFFRDEKVYESLRNILERQFSNKSKHENIRIWVPGCATGEEVYSIGILVTEIIKKNNLATSFQIFGTDIDETALMVARNGIYSQESLQNIPSELKDFYFHDLGNKKYEVKKILKSGILFSKHDITSNPPFLKLDVISCRNVLVYFEAAAQERVVATFHYALNPNGILILGKNENPKGLEQLFRPFDKRNKIYGKNNNIPPTMRKRLQTTKNYSLFLSRSIEPEQYQPTTIDLKTLAIQTILDSSDYSFVILNRNWDILELYGKVNEYLEITAGIMNSNIKKFIKSDYSAFVLSAINHYNTKQTPFIGNWIRRQKEANRNELFRVKLVPIPEKEQENLVVLLFESIALENEEELIPKDLDIKAILERNKELEREIITTKEALQTYIEELETTNEELQSANEELMSINEELQATNEELETTNEELQSTNEELQTAYTQMKSINDSLEESKEKLKKTEQNLHLLIDTNPQAFILIDSSYKILEFNKVANLLSEKFLNKPLKKEENIFDYNILESSASLKENLTKVLNGKIIELERKIELNNTPFWYKISYYPILSKDKVDTIVAFIMDISDKKKNLELNEILMYQLNQELKKKTEELTELNRSLNIELEKEQKLVNELENAKKELLLTKEKYKILTSNIPSSDLFLFDKNLKVLLACGKELFKKDWSEIEYHNKTFQELFGDQIWELLEPLFESFLKGEKVFSEITIHLEIFDIEIVPIFDFENNLEYGICVVQNVTETRLFEIHSRYHENILQILLNIAPIGICLFDKDLKCIMANQEASKFLGMEKEELQGKELKNILPPLKEISYEKILSNIKNNTIEKNNTLWENKEKAMFVETLWSSFTSVDENNFYLILFKDVSKLKQYELELEKINQELEERVLKEVAASRAKDMLLITQSRFAAMGEMISNIAHQWRQPLSSLASIVQNLIDAYRYGELTEELVNRFEKKVFPIIEHMSKTIDDFRNFFRPNREKQSFNVATECIDKAINILENRIQKLGVQIIHDVREQIIVEGYPNEFLQVLINILNNSLDAFESKQNPDKRIILSCYSKNNKKIISILDNAGGIPEEIVNKIFDPYFTTKEKGTGIGLYMSRMIVERSMSGRLLFTPHESGAEFLIEL